MRQKILAFLGTILMMSGFFAVTAPQNTMAEGLADANGSCGAPMLLGFRPWYADLCKDDKRGQNSEVVQPVGEEETVKFIWIIILNVLFDVFLAVGYLSLGFIIYGGYLYIVSQGDPGRAAKGQKTLTSAIIGTILTMTATVIVNTAKIVLGISGNGWKQHADDGFTSVQVQNIFNWAYTVAGIVAVIFIIKGGIEYVLSRGDTAKTQKAMRSIVYAVVGLVIVLLAAVITTFVINATGGAMEAQA